MLRDLSAATRSKAGSYDHGQKGNKGKRDIAKRDNAKQRDGYYAGAYNAYKKPRLAGGEKRSFTCYECHGMRTFADKFVRRRC